MIPTLLPPADLLRLVAKMEGRPMRDDGRPLRPPIVECRLEPPKRGRPREWSFFCPYCQRRHYHGAAPGHRAAHCSPRIELNAQGDPIITSEPSPYKVTGYILRLAPRR
jgi:hypothetical protein